MSDRQISMSRRPGLRARPRTAALLLAQWLLYAFVFWLPVILWVVLGGG